VVSSKDAAATAEVAATTSQTAPATIQRSKGWLGSERARSVLRRIVTKRRAAASNAQVPSIHSAWAAGGASGARNAATTASTPPLWLSRATLTRRECCSAAPTKRGTAWQAKPIRNSPRNPKS
jgi:hypothetical protein